MQKYQNSKVVVHPQVCIGLAIVVMVVPLRWIVAWVIAMFVHELSHLLALRYFNIRIDCISVGLFGARIETEPMLETTEAICAAAGPLGGFILVIFFRLFPEIAVCAFVQSCYNLLPVHPLDGGRVVSCALIAVKNKIVAQTCDLIVRYLCFALLFIASVFALYLKLGPIPLICTVSLLLKNTKIKFPCKQSKQIVQ